MPYPNWYIFNTTSRPKVQVFLAEEEAERLEGAEDLKVRCKSVSSKYKSGSYHTQEIQTIHKTASMGASVDI